jgi:hypothetical protein
MPNVVKEIDKGWTKIRAELLKLREKSVVLVGIQGELASQPHGDASNVEIGSWQEFGTSRGVPERSFLRATIDTNRQRYAAMIQKSAERIVTGKSTVEKELALWGERVVGDVKQRIAKGIPPPLKDATIKRKGSSKPLIDSGQLRNSITYTVSKHGVGAEGAFSPVGKG